MRKSLLTILTTVTIMLLLAYIGNLLDKIKHRSYRVGPPHADY
jgi:hypothetical protein